MCLILSKKYNNPLDLRVEYLWFRKNYHEKFNRFNSGLKIFMEKKLSAKSLPAKKSSAINADNTGREDKTELRWYE